MPDGVGGVVVQQSTEDADAEVWNLVYSDPSARPLLDSGRLGFELKVGQGAKPGLGGMTVVDAADSDRLSEQFALEPVFDPATGRVLHDLQGKDPRFGMNTGVREQRGRVWLGSLIGTTVASFALPA